LSRKDPKPEFRRYRQGLQIATFTVTTAGIVWLLASVAHTLFAHPAVRSQDAARFSGRSDDVEALLHCQTDVESLFDALNRKLFDLQALGARYDFQLAEQWEAFSKQWKRRRLEIGARCRFEELANHGLGAAYDRLAAVYDELERMQRAYAVLLYHYVDHHESTVNDIRHALETSRKAIERQRVGAGGTG
jgi:hypothetical protein